MLISFFFIYLFGLEFVVLIHSFSFQVADLRDLDEFQDTFPGLDTLPLYKDALKKLEEEGIPYR